MAEKQKRTNKEKLKEVTTGLEPIVGDRPTVEIEGREYTLRRLGIQDTFRIIRLISVGLTEMAGLINSDQLDAQTAALALVAAIPYMEDDILDLLASLISVEPKDIRNTELFPMGSEIVIIDALADHQDLKAFFTQLQRLMETNPAVQQAMEQATPKAQ